VTGLSGRARKATTLCQQGTFLLVGGWFASALQSAPTKARACEVKRPDVLGWSSTLDAMPFEQEPKMIRTLAYTALCSATLIGPAAYSADNAMPPANASAQSQTPSGVPFVTGQDKSQWRVPKLIGVGVYGPDDKQIGKIDDLMVDKNGATQTIVIGVGGFLGFGKKDVAVPFSAMQWRTEARKTPTDTASSTGNPASAGTTTAQQPPIKEVDPATAAASQGYPDKAVLNVTLDELKAAPDFKYVSSTLAETEMRPAGSDDQMKKQTP
jgi:sporulation protein YlmC with PRC-barrel domain